MTRSIARPAASRIVPLAAAIIVSGLFYFFRPDELRDSTYLVAALTIGFGIAPIVAYASNPRTTEFPLFSLTCLYYTAAFCIPAFCYAAIRPGTLNGFIFVSDETITAACLGIFSLLAGGALGGTSRSARLVRVTSIVFRPTSESLLACGLCLGIMQLVWVSSSLRNVPTLFHLANSLGLFSAILMASACYKRSQNSLWRGLFLFGFVPLHLLTRLATGSMMNALVFIVLLCSVFIFERPNWKRPIVAIALLAGIAMPVVMEVRNDFRRRTWSEENVYSFWDRVGMLIESTTQPAENAAPIPRFERESDRISVPMARMSGLSLLDKTLDQIPDSVPFLHGRSLEGLLYIWAPRFLLPNKPTQEWGFEFSYMIGFRGSEDRTTSINVPWLVEFYANFGWTGMYLGTFLVGLMAVRIENIWRGMNSDEIRSCGLLVLTHDVWYQESNIAVMLGNKFLIACVIVFFVHFVLRGAGGVSSKSKNPERLDIRSRGTIAVRSGS